MIFSKKEKELIAYTVEQCPSCKNELKRKFKEGDVVFTESSTCACGSKMRIAKIFGEPIE